MGGDGGKGGTGGSEVSCEGTVCPCSEGGILAAIAHGGGPYTFDCDGPTTVVTEEEILIDNDVVLDGEGNLTVDGNDAHRVFHVPEGVSVEVDGFSVTGGNPSVVGPTPENDGGGVLNFGTMTLTNSIVSGNSADAGGAIWNLGTMTLTNCAVLGNSADGGGGGIANQGFGTMALTDSTVSGNTAEVGGGIFNEVATMRVENSTVSGNTAVGEVTSEGGGIYNFGTMTLTNGTVSGNNAGFGGGAGISNAGTMTLTNSTVSDNWSVGQGGILNHSSTQPPYTNSTITVTNSTVSGNAAAGGDCVGSAVTSGGHNLESPGDTCGFEQPTDQVNVSVDDLNLGPLQDNGGPTETHALLPGSVAIDVIPVDMCEVDEDQRGETRPGGATCDVGAFEVQP